MRRSTFVVSIALLGIALLGVTPAGAKTPVFCNMTITLPGQYVLTSDLACGAAPGLQVAANDVHINFKGHTLSGPGTGSGIITASGGACVGVTGLHINGGTVTGFGSGIDLCAPGPGSVTMDAHVNGMTVTGNSFAGVQLFNSDGNHINGSNISGNVGVGVTLVNSDNNRFNTNQVNENEAPFRTCGGYALFNSSNDNLITSNDISNNGTVNGGFGVLITPGSKRNTVRGNIVNGNRLFGMLVGGANNTIQANTVNQSTLFGILVFGVNNTIQSNAAFNNPILDLVDDNANCDNNTWKSNIFGTSNQTCIQ